MNAQTDYKTVACIIVLARYDDPPSFAYLPRIERGKRSADRRLGASAPV